MQESEFRLSQESDGVVNNGVEETLDGENEGVQKGKVTLFGQDEQDQPEFEFRHESPDALVRPVNVGRLINNGMRRNGESDAFFEPQDSQSVTSNSEAEDAGGQGWWKPSSPYGTSAGTPGAEFYDAFEGTTRFMLTLCFANLFLAE